MVCMLLHSFNWRHGAKSIDLLCSIKLEYMPFMIMNARTVSLCGNRYVYTAAKQACSRQNIQEESMDTIYQKW